MQQGIWLSLILVTEARDADVCGPVTTYTGEPTKAYRGR
jgi:hypothetical protein